MIHPNGSDTATVRSVFIISPDNKLKLTLTYPASTGRNFLEILRVLDSLQLTSQHSVATPADWQQGEDVIIVAGMFLHSALGQYLLWAGVSLFALVAFFQLITLPVEYDASSRAKAELNRLGIVRSEEAPHVSRMLHAAALTYVAAMINAVLQLLHYLMLARSRERD